MTETITIIEGPTPTFFPAPDVWSESLREASVLRPVATCQMRAFNSIALMLRCRLAWNKGLPVLLDYPDRAGLRKTVEVLAAKPGHSEEGDLFYMWIAYPEEE